MSRGLERKEGLGHHRGHCGLAALFCVISLVGRFQITEPLYSRMQLDPTLAVEAAGSTASGRPCSSEGMQERVASGLQKSCRAEGTAGGLPAFCFKFTS